MAQNAENFGPNVVELDDENQQVLTVKVQGDVEPRLRLNLDGTIEAGDGVTVPTAATLTPDQTAALYVPFSDQAFRGQLLAAGEETMPRNTHLGVTATGTGAVRLSYFTARRTEACTKIRTNTSSTAAGATPTLCRMGIYIVAANGDLTLVAACANDTTLWASSSTLYTRDLTSTFNKVEGQRYAAASLVVTGATAPTIQGANSFAVGVYSAAPRITGQIAGQTDLPASIPAGSVTDSVGFQYFEVLP